MRPGDEHAEMSPVFIQMETINAPEAPDFLLAFVVEYRFIYQTALDRSPKKEPTRLVSVNGTEVTVDSSLS